MEERIVLDGSVAAVVAAAGAADAGASADAKSDSGNTSDLLVDNTDSSAGDNSDSDHSGDSDVSDNTDSGTDTGGQTDSVVAEVIDAIADSGSDTATLKALIVNSDIEDLSDLLAAVDDSVIVVTFDGDTPDMQAIIDQLTALADGVDYSSIGIITHGADGVIAFSDSDPITAATLATDTEQQEFFAELGALLTDDGRIDLVSCDSGDGTAGDQLIAEIAEISGADVAASTDATGNESDGGDWILEKGDVDLTHEYFDVGALDNFDGVLTSFTFHDLSFDLAADYADDYGTLYLNFDYLTNFYYCLSGKEITIQYYDDGILHSANFAADDLASASFTDDGVTMSSCGNTFVLDLSAYSEDLAVQGFEIIPGVTYQVIFSDNIFTQYDDGCNVYNSGLILTFVVADTSEHHDNASWHSNIDHSNSGGNSSSSADGDSLSGLVSDIISGIADGSISDGSDAISGDWGDSSDTGTGDSAEGDSTESDSTESDSAEGDSTESDSAEGDSAEGDSAEGDSAEGDSAEGDSAEGSADSGSGEGEADGGADAGNDGFALRSDGAASDMMVTNPFSEHITSSDVQILFDRTVDAFAQLGLDNAAIYELIQDAMGDTMTTASLVASCQQCLDNANLLMGELLAESDQDFAISGSGATAQGESVVEIVQAAIDRVVQARGNALIANDLLRIIALNIGDASERLAENTFAAGVMRLGASNEELTYSYEVLNAICNVVKEHQDSGVPLTVAQLNGLLPEIEGHARTVAKAVAEDGDRASRDVLAFLTRELQQQGVDQNNLQQQVSAVFEQWHESIGVSAVEPFAVNIDSDVAVNSVVPAGAM